MEISERLSWWGVILMVFMTQPLQGARLDCGREGIVEVAEHSPLALHCDTDTPWMYDPNTTLTWTITKDSERIGAGSCTSSRYDGSHSVPAPNCMSPLGPDVTVDSDPHAYRSFYSIMDIGNVTRAMLEGAVIACNDTGRYGQRRNRFNTCRVKIFVNAEVEQCHLDIISQNWTVAGFCDVTKIYSPDGTYICSVETQLNKRRASYPSIVSFTPSPFNDTNTNHMYYRGRCSFSQPLPAQRGTVSYYTTISPGNTRTLAGTLSVAPPADDPSLTYPCRNSSVPETGGPPNSPCVCSVSSVGTPKGRLIWYAGDTILAAGDYGVTSAQFPYGSVNRSHDKEKVTCELDWALSARTSFTARIAYGPDEVSVHYQRPFLVNGNTSMTLTCVVRDASPLSTLQQEWGGLCQGQRGPTCTLYTQGAEDDGKEVTCTATNPANNGHSARATVLLDLTYPPSESPLITGHAEQPVFDGEKLTLTCLVKGGKPPVRSVTLSCPAVVSPVNQVTGIGEQTTLTIDVTTKDSGKVCMCRALWREDSLYSLTTKITLIVFNGTRPQQISDDAFRAGRSQGVGIGIGIMLLLLVVVAAGVMVVQWRRGRLPPCLICGPVYDVPKRGNRQSVDDEHHYTDLSTYEAVGGPSTSTSCKAAAANETTASARRSENVYVNSGSDASV